MVKLSVFFVLLGPMHLHAARRTLMKLTPEWQEEEEVGADCQSVLVSTFAQKYQQFPDPFEVELPSVLEGEGSSVSCSKFANVTFFTISFVTVYFSYHNTFVKKSLSKASPFITLNISEHFR